jgi:DNA polymerase III alpha subunit
MNDAHEYIELHAASAFSFLAGASPPDRLIERAGELGMRAMALADERLLVVDRRVEPRRVGRTGRA